jgi:hypothetical protein
MRNVLLSLAAKLAPQLALIKDAEPIRSFIEAEVPPPPAIGAKEPQQMSRAALHMKSECWSSGH